MPHLRACRIRAFGDQFEPNGGAAVGTFGADSALVKRFVLLGFEPHQLEALRAATDLRCHAFPRTLPPHYLSDDRTHTLIQDARHPQERRYLLGEERP